jgi:hypothetical protein
VPIGMYEPCPAESLGRLLHQSLFAGRRLPHARRQTAGVAPTVVLPGIIGPPER